MKDETLCAQTFGAFDDMVFGSSRGKSYGVGGRRHGLGNSEGQIIFTEAAVCGNTGQSARLRDLAAELVF